MANDYYFFTDINQKASGASDYINVQTSGAYGPIPPAPVGHTTDEYRVTSLHTASYNPTAYAACDGIVCVQRIPNTIPSTSPPLVNVILKPLVQPALNFAPIKYIIYKGILADSLINGAETAAAGNNDLTKSIWADQKTRNAKETGAANPFAPPNPSADALGVGRTVALSAEFGNAKPIDHLFHNLGALPPLKYQLPLVKGRWSIGQFYKDGFGIEVLMEGLNFHHSLSSARKLEHKISVATLTGSENPAQTFDHWHAKEQVLGYMDPCAFYGSFFLVGIQAKTSGNVPFVPKSGNTLYQDVLFAFANKKVAYLDIRNEHNFSFNYFKNYGATIKVGSSTTPVDYYASKWPIMTLPASTFAAANTNKARSAFRIQLPVGDNPKPLLYVSQGYRDINSKGNGFPAELKGAERFYNSFKTPVGGYTATPNNPKNLGMTSMSFVVPNVTGQSATTPVSCYIRLKYLKQQQGATTVPTVIQSENYLDNLFYPLDLRILFSGTASIKSSVYDDEVYVNAQNVAGLKCDFIGKVGVARDANNTCFFVIPTNVRTNEGQASALVTLSGETSDYLGSYPNLVALKYPLERVRKSELVFSAANKVPVAKFVSDGDAAAQAKFKRPDFNIFFIVVVANSTFDKWKQKVADAHGDGFRAYLGVKDLQQQLTDGVGVEYTSFELVLRVFVLDANTGQYNLQEIGTDPDNSTNVKVYAHAGA